jgi:hypothetical protein
MYQVCVRAMRNAKSCSAKRPNRCANAAAEAARFTARSADGLITRNQGRPVTVAVRPGKGEG